MIVKGYIPVVAGVVWLACAASVCAGEGQYVNAGAHYSLRLPAGWKEFSKSSLALANRIANRIDGRNQYVTGFQREDRPDLLYPYVLVQHYAFNSEPTLDDLFAMVKRDLAPSIAQTTHKMAGVVGNATVEPPSLDREHHRIYQPLATNVLWVGRVKALSVMCIGKHGAVWLYGYAPEADWPAFAPVFQAMADSLKFEPGYDYDESLAQQSRWYFSVKDTLGGALPGFIAGGIFAALGMGVLGIRKLFARSAAKPE